MIAWISPDGRLQLSSSRIKLPLSSRERTAKSGRMVNPPPLSTAALTATFVLANIVTSKICAVWMPSALSNFQRAGLLSIEPAMNGRPRRSVGVLIEGADEAQDAGATTHVLNPPSLTAR